MDLAAPFKTEVIRPLVTLAVPGTIAIGPFVLLVGEYVPPVAAFWTAHPNAFAVMLVLVTLAAGFILDDLGSLIETGWIDPKVKEKKPNHDQDWRKYLQLQLQDELIAQRYLRNKFTQLKFELSMGQSLLLFWVVRNKFTQLKFELSMGQSLLLFWVGGLWLQTRVGIWSWCGFGLVTLLLIPASVAFFWAARVTAEVLSDTRSLIIEAIEAGPKGIPPKKPV